MEAALAYQFVHVNTYSIKTGGAGIAAEAGRKPDHSRHVENPQPPVLLAGVQPELAWSKIEDRHSKARDLVTMKNGRKAERGLRSDASVLLAAVASYPEPTETADTTTPEFQDWQRRSIAWLTEQHGKPLSVVLHLDETHPHIHFLTAPDLEDGQRMKDIHPGEKAKAEIGGRKAGRIEKRHAFSEAMRGYQDGYHQAVGIHHAQARLGPKRQRLTRDEWKGQQADLQRQAEHLKQLEIQSDAITAERTQLEQDAAQAQALVAEAQGELDKREAAQVKAQDDVNKTHDSLKTYRSDLERSKGDLEERLTRVSQREERLGGLWGAIKSAVTFGRAGTARRVKDAVAAVEAELTGKLTASMTELKNAAQAHENATQRLNGENRLLTEQNLTLAGAVSAAERAQRQAQELADKLKPLEASNRDLEAARDRLADLVDDLEAAAAAGDLALVQDLLHPSGDGPGLRV